MEKEKFYANISLNAIREKETIKRNKKGCQMAAFFCMICEGLG
tara:strand:- start:1797 stop:1925 length:129 start_codon:yes stop_codon:yes gene_type:complete